MINEGTFWKFFRTCCYEILFKLSGEFHKQVKGLGMELPLGSTLANDFMCHHEET